MRTDGARRSVELEVTPFRSSDGRIYFVISFREPGQEKAKPEPKGKAAKPAPARRVKEADLLRLELEASREHLQSVMTEKDVGTEELRAAYEEIQSSNEELQSTNEELETAKEELQSINEELSTVNDELLARNLELSQAHDDLSNLVGSVSIPIVMLDRAAAPASLHPGDRGRSARRPLRHRAPRHRDQAEGRRPGPGSAPAGGHRFSSHPIVREVKDADGRWYSMRAGPTRPPKVRSRERCSASSMWMSSSEAWSTWPSRRSWAMPSTRSTSPSTRPSSSTRSCAG